MKHTNLHRAMIIARTDLLQIYRSRDFWMPLVIIAALFFVALPVLLFGSLTTIADQGMVQQIGDLVDTLPAQIKSQVQGEAPNVQAAYAMAVYLFAPLAIIVPLTVCSAIGSHTIIGERERGSGEFLAHSPASEQEIFIGKMIAALLPGYAVEIVGFGLYSLVVNLIVGPKVGGWFFPTANWWLLVLWVVPPFLALVVALILRISARVTSAAAAQQSSALITLPLVIGAYGMASASLARAGGFILLVGLGAWAAAALALWRGITSVRRERLLGLGG
jgi:ABC-type Na+ efflux pump permease subunit